MNFQGRDEEKKEVGMKCVCCGIDGADPKTGLCDSETIECLRRALSNERAEVARLRAELQAVKR